MATRAYVISTTRFAQYNGLILRSHTLGAANIAQPKVRSNLWPLAYLGSLLVRSGTDGIRAQLTRLNSQDSRLLPSDLAQQLEKSSLSIAACRPVYGDALVTFVKTLVLFAIVKVSP